MDKTNLTIAAFFGLFIFALVGGGLWSSNLRDRNVLRCIEMTGEILTCKEAIK